MPHEYWRVFISAVAGGGGVEYTSANEVEMRESVGGASVCTGGAIIASSEVDLGGNGRASEAYDGSLFTYWVSELSPPQWIGYHFASAKEIVEIAIHNPADDPGNPEALSLEYSDDGIEWTSADNWSGAAWPTAGWQVFTRSAIPYGATAAGTPRRPSGASAAHHHAPPIAASAAGAPRRPSGSASARYAPPAFAAAAGMPRRPSGAVAVTHTFAPPPHVLATRYSLTLTGAADGLPDAALPLANWQAAARLVGSTYLTCTVPFSPAVEAAILARPHGTLIVRQHLIYASETITAEIVAAPWDAAPRIDEGGRSASVTLAGLAPQPARAPKSVTLRGVSYRRLDGGVTVRSAIDLFAAPGDTLDYGDGDLVADQITYICTPGAEWMEARSNG